MSIWLGEWGSSGQTEAHLVCEGITQQPGSFYNGNFSSSIWGNPPTPPLWREMPAPNAAFSTLAGQPLSFFSSSKHTKESVIPCKTETLNRKEEKLSRWDGDFSFQQQTGPEESSTSPFSFGFPPSSPPSSSPTFHEHVPSNGSSYSQSHFTGKSTDVNSLENPINGNFSIFDKGSSQRVTQERGFSLKELTNKWESILQSQDDSCCSVAYQSPLHGSFAPASSVGMATSKEVRKPLDHGYANCFVDADGEALHERQPLKHSYGNPFANADMHAAAFLKQQSSHQFTGILHAFPNLEKCNGTQMLFNQKGDSSTFVFGSCPTSDTSANVRLSQQKVFVFGSGSASDISPNVGFSQQRGVCASAAGIMPRASSTNTKVKKHKNFANKKKSTVPVSKAFPAGPCTPSFDTSCFSNSGFKFTMGSNEADCLHCPDLSFNDMDGVSSHSGPVSSMQNPFASVQNDSLSFEAYKADSQTSFFAGAASTVTEDTHSVSSSIEGKLFQQRNKTQHPQSISEQFSNCSPFLQEENSIKSCGLDRDFVEGPSSRGKSSAYTSDRNDEKWEAGHVKTGLFHEGLLKPSLETNRTFEGSKLAEFDLNSPCKLSAEDLQEKTAKWVRSGEEIKRQKENQEPKFFFGSQKASKPFIFSASRAQGSTKHANLSIPDMNKKERCSKGSKESKELEHLINKLGEKMANLGKSHDTQSNIAACRGETIAEGMKESNASSEGLMVKDSQGAADIFDKDKALSHSIEDLREQLAKLGSSNSQVNSQNDKAGEVNSSFHKYRISMEHAVMELREQIAKLGNFGEETKEDTAEKAKSFASEACESSAIKHAVEELRERIAKLGRAVSGNHQDNYSACKAHQSDINEQSVEDLREKITTLGKTDKIENNHNLDHETLLRPNKSKVQEAFVFSSNNATASKERDSTHFHWSKADAGNSSGIGFVNTAQFNPFSTVPQFTSLGEVQSLSSFPMENPFTAGQAPSFTEGSNRAKFSSYEMPDANNGDGEELSHKGFEFHGTEGLWSGRTTQRKNGTRKKKSSVLQRKIHTTSTAHNTGSPMDFSPCGDKVPPSLPKFGSDEAQEAPVWKFPNPNSVEDASMNVEELRTATSNLTIGQEDESRMGDEEKSKPFEHATNEGSPFVLRQKKATWKRASRNSNSTKWTDLKPQFTFGSKTAQSGSCEFTFKSQTARSVACGTVSGLADEHTQNSSGEGFNLRSFSPSADPYRKDAREKPLRKSTWDQGSAIFGNGKGESNMPTFVNTKTNELFRFDNLGKEQKASSISRELPVSPTATRTATAEQVCENWRLRGNQAYAKGDYEKAEDCYSRGVGSVSLEDTSQGCIKASMLCYSNRAATRMAVGRMREALEDCKQAMMLDSSFLRVRIRAASCHLALGENNAAAALFVECWSRAKESSSSEMKIMEEAMEGIRKSQQFGNLWERASKLCQGESPTDASSVLNLLNEALLISPFSEALLELKAQTLFSVRRFEDVLQLCEQTLSAAKDNAIPEHHQDQSPGKDNVSLNLWRWCMCGKCLFHLGRLEEASNLLTKYEEASHRISSSRAANRESMAPLLSTIRDLLEHKASGNEAFQAGRHVEAVEHYTAALACNGESRPYNAVCFCNRAAASQALGHISDAIADCSRAIVLDPHYAKAISRRATLHEMVRDYGQTCNDLRRLITLLESREACSKSPKSTRSGSKNSQDLRQARDRLEKATKELKKCCAVNHYLILGLDVSCSSNDIKKAYRKAALKHHPDKAGQVLVRGENGDDGSLWKEVGEEARRDAERLFKLIGEAYAILSDPTKRAEYDADSHMPRARNTGYGSTDENFSTWENHGRRQNERRGWHSPRYYRWQSGPDAAEPDTYSERGSGGASASKEGRSGGRGYDFYW